MLHVTEPMIRELYESVPHDSGDTRGLAVGPAGWRINSVDSLTRDPLVVLIAEDVASAVDEDPFASGEPQYTAELGERLVQEWCRPIPHASGSADEPGPGVRWAVVTGTWNGPGGPSLDGEQQPRAPWGPEEITRDPDTACWVDLDQCIEIIPESDDIEDRPAREVSLWITPDGTGYLLRLHSRYQLELEEEWLWCAAADAAQLIRAAKTDDTHDGDHAS